MLWDKSHTLAPEEPHVMLIQLHDGSEQILPEAFVKERFGEKRWLAITTGNDKVFSAFPYHAD